MYRLTQAMLNRLTDSHLKTLAPQGAISAPENFDKATLSRALYDAQDKPAPSTLNWEILHDWLLQCESETEDRTVHQIRQLVKTLLH